MRILTISLVATLGLAHASSVAAQQNAPAAGPVILLLPVSARAMGDGNAWVAGRDEFAVFYNPALLNASNGFSVSAASYGGDTRVGAFTAGQTIGPVTMGFGVHVADFSVVPGNEPPFTPSTLTHRGSSDAQSLEALVAWQSTYKGFRIGVAGKYAEDVSAVDVGPARPTTVTRGSAILADIGASHPLWQGLAGIALQNLGKSYSMGDRKIAVPTTIALGWTIPKSWGPFDYGLATQVSARERWVAPAAGLEMGWSWIEGFSVTGRAGVRRTETSAERPVSLGGSFNADRLSIDYGMSFFEGNRYAQRVTVRWR